MLILTLRVQSSDVVVFWFMIIENVPVGITGGWDCCSYYVRGHIPLPLADNNLNALHDMVLGPSSEDSAYGSSEP